METASGAWGFGWRRPPGWTSPIDWGSETERLESNDWVSTARGSLFRFRRTCVSPEREVVCLRQDASIASRLAARHSRGVNQTAGGTALACFFEIKSGRVPYAAALPLRSSRLWFRSERIQSCLAGSNDLQLEQLWLLGLYR